MVDKMKNHLDNLGLGGLLLFTQNRANGMSEPEAAFKAVRRTAEIMTEQLEREMKKLMDLHNDQG